MSKETISPREARRLALHCSGLLAGQDWPRAVNGRNQAAAAAAAVARLGYLQLDTIPICGARSHGLVLASRLPGYRAAEAEKLLGTSDSLFEYWGHEVSWLPLSLYGAVEFRRQEFRQRSWWRDIVRSHPEWVTEVLRRIEAEGPLGSRDFASDASDGSWYGRPPRKVLAALWSTGELAVRDRIGFERVFDLAERVIPGTAPAPLPEVEGVALLLETAAALHGWATPNTLCETFRLRRGRHAVAAAVARLGEEGRLVACDLVPTRGRRTPGFVRPADLERVAALAGARGPRGVLLSPFDPLVWDRKRAEALFGFDAIMEFFKPASKRRYGYYCLPVLAGDDLVSRVDLRADRKAGTFELLARHDVAAHAGRAQRAVPIALARHAQAVGLLPGRLLPEGSV
jgi:uncharacterized protein YcaQ